MSVIKLPANKNTEFSVAMIKIKKFKKHKSHLLLKHLKNNCVDN